MATPTTSIPGFKYSSTTPSGQVLYTADDGKVYDATGVQLKADPKNPISYIVDTGVSSTNGVSGSTQIETKPKSKITSTTEHYGRTGTPEAVVSNEKQALTDVNRMKDISGLQGVVDKATLDKIFSDPLQLAFYVHAIAFGGYTNQDIVRDMQRLNLAYKGDKNADATVIISPDVMKSTYYGTEDGKKALNYSSTALPPLPKAFLDTGFLNYGINMPDELFQKLVPILDRNSKEFKDAVAGVQSAFYDLANAQIQATSEQEKAAADYNYKEFQRQVAEKYGIALSDDATKAWTQIEGLQDTMSTRGISGSGMEAEGVDKILQDTRKADQRLRSQKLTDEEAKKAAYYTSSASSAEIAGLSEEDKIKYGLKPSADIASQYDMNNLKMKYPKLSEQELLDYRNSVLDENGNYRSTIYAKKYSDIKTNKMTQKADAENEVIARNEAAETSMYSNFDKSQPLSQSTPEGTDLLKKKDDAQKVIDEQNANKARLASDATKGIINFNSNTGKQLATNESFVDSSGKTITQGQKIGATSPTTVTNINTNSPTKPTILSTSSVPTISSPYKIVSGDTLGAIAAKNKTTVDAIAKLNKIADPNKIYAGQTIKLN